MSALTQRVGAAAVTLGCPLDQRPLREGKYTRYDELRPLTFQPGDEVPALLPTAVTD